MTYDWQDDSRKCYEVAIESKRLDEPSKTPVSVLYPIRRGTKIFVKRDGVEIELHPMEAKLIADAWNNAVGGAYVRYFTDGDHE